MGQAGRLVCQGFAVRGGHAQRVELVTRACASVTVSSAIALSCPLGGQNSDTPVQSRAQTSPSRQNGGWDRGSGDCPSSKPLSEAKQRERSYAKARGIGHHLSTVQLSPGKNPGGEHRHPPKAVRTRTRGSGLGAPWPSHLVERERESERSYAGGQAGHSYRNPTRNLRIQQM